MFCREVYDLVIVYTGMTTEVKMGLLLGVSQLERLSTRRGITFSEAKDKNGMETKQYFVPLLFLGFSPGI